MADKMMRIAGRGKDGTAKALSTTNDGEILSQINNSTGKKTLINHHDTILIDTNPLGTNITTTGGGIHDVDGRFNELEISLRFASKMRGKLTVSHYFNYGSSGRKFIGTDVLEFDDIHMTARVKTRGNLWTISVLNETNSTKELLGHYVAGSYNSTNISTISNANDTSRIGYDVENGGSVTDYSFEKDIDGYSALRVVDSAPWGYDNEINSTNVFNTGNKRISQQVMQKTTLTKEGLTSTDIAVPKGAKGVIFQTEIINVNGSFGENQGLRPNLHFMTSDWAVNPVSIMNISGGYKSSNGVITIMCHPDIDAELTNATVYDNVHPVIAVKSTVFDVMRFRFTTSGDFSSGNSIEFHGRALWLF